MARKKAGCDPNWTQEETQKFLRKKAQKVVDAHKKQESGKKYKRVPIFPNGFKLVPIKDDKK